MQTAIELRQQMPQRSVEQIIFLLEEKGTVPPNSIAASTLARHFRKAGVNRQELLKDKATGAKGHRR
ncbi:IS481 family transposase, partial [Peptococcaceae bacterium]|nr:IS481 family transposase [Peptococcaceae bacterium]